MLFTVLPPGGVVPRHHLDAVVELVNNHFVGSVNLWVALLSETLVDFVTSVLVIL